MEEKPFRPIQDRNAELLGTFIRAPTINVTEIRATCSLVKKTAKNTMGFISIRDLKMPQACK